MAGDNQAITGQLAQAAGEILPLKVCQSRAGFYIGTTTELGEPFSRESAEYWAKRPQAENALQSGKWSQRLEP
jgi:hypothetical protein